jgi:hypothetical protein
VIGSMIDHWKYTWPEVWTNLAKARRSPSDLFIDLYRIATDSLQNPPEYKQFELTMNDPLQARQAFEQLRAQDFGDELSVVGFLESAFVTIQDFEIPRFAKLYKYLVRSFIKKYNLRYRIDDPFRVRLILPGVFASFYEDLTRVNGTDPHLKNLMNNFELTFGSYTRTKQTHELNACLTNAFIYAEGLAGKTWGENDTLGNLCDCLQCWPHTTIRESLKKLYGFRNNYPGLGHAGNPESKLRELEPRDAIVVCLLLLSFAGYLTNEVRIEDSFTH